MSLEARQQRCEERAIVRARRRTKKVKMLAKTLIQKSEFAKFIQFEARGPRGEDVVPTFGFIIRPKGKRSKTDRMKEFHLMARDFREQFTIEAEANIKELEEHAREAA